MLVKCTTIPTIEISCKIVTAFLPLLGLWREKSEQCAMSTRSRGETAVAQSQTPASTTMSNQPGGARKDGRPQAATAYASSGSGAAPAPSAAGNSSSVGPQYPMYVTPAGSYSAEVIYRRSVQPEVGPAGFSGAAQPHYIAAAPADGQGRGLPADEGSIPTAVTPGGYVAVQPNPRYFVAPAAGEVGVASGGGGQGYPRYSVPPRLWTSIVRPPQAGDNGGAPQGAPRQGLPQQGHPQQGHSQQGPPQQGAPQQGAPQEGSKWPANRGVKRSRAPVVEDSGTVRQIQPPSVDARPANEPGMPEFPAPGNTPGNAGAKRARTAIGAVAVEQQRIWSIPQDPGGVGARFLPTMGAAQPQLPVKVVPPNWAPAPMPSSAPIQRTVRRKAPRQGKTSASHECSDCGKTFSSNGNLKRHMRIHTGDRPFECPTCNKRFRQRVHLKKHMRKHTGEKPFACSFCMRAFSQKNSLMGHIRAKHTLECPYACACGRRFPTNAHLRGHQKRCVMQMQATNPLQAVVRSTSVGSVAMQAASVTAVASVVAPVVKAPPAAAARVVKRQVVKSPAKKPSAKAPGVVAPVVEAPVVEAPVVEAPVVEAPAIGAPIVEAVPTVAVESKRNNESEPSKDNGNAMDAAKKTITIEGTVAAE